MASADKKRILIVDDDACFALVVKCALEGTGRYDVRWEEESFRAVRSARAYQPDLILLDLLMPGMDGAEAASRLQADDALARIPVIMLTATLPRSCADAAERVVAGRVFLAKPVSLEALLGCIEKNTQ